MAPTTQPTDSAQMDTGNAETVVLNKPNTASGNEKDELRNSVFLLAKSLNLHQLDFNGSDTIEVKKGDNNITKYSWDKSRTTFSCRDHSRTRIISKSEEKAELNLILYNLKKLESRKNRNDFHSKLSSGELSVNDFPAISEYEKSRKEVLLKRTSYLQDVLANADIYHGKLFNSEAKAEMFNKFFTMKSDLIRLDYSEKLREIFQSLETNGIVEDDRMVLKNYVTLETEEASNLNSSDFKQIDPSWFPLFEKLFREVTLLHLTTRKEGVLKNLNIAKAKDAEIQQKRLEIRGFKADSEWQTLVDENEISKLGKLVQTHTNIVNKNYSAGFLKAKSETEQVNKQEIIYSPPHKSDFEEECLNKVLNLISKELGLIHKKEMQGLKKQQEIDEIRNVREPFLNFEENFLKTLLKSVDKEISKVKLEISELNQSLRNLEIRIRREQMEIAMKSNSLVEFYRNMDICLSEIESLKESIQVWQSAHDAAEPMAIRVLKNDIFELAGGQKKGQSEYINHEDCPKTLWVPNVGRVPCAYRAATDDTVDYCLKRALDFSATSVSDSELLEALKAYKHSAGSERKHFAALKEAACRVFAHHDRVKNAIQEEKAKCMEKIREFSNALRIKEERRNNLRSEILNLENFVNESTILLADLEKIEKVDGKKLGDLNTLQAFLQEEVTLDISNQMDEKIQEQDKLSTTVNQLLESVAEIKDSVQNQLYALDAEEKFTTALSHCEARWKMSICEKTAVEKEGKLQLLSSSVSKINGELKLNEKKSEKLMKRIQKIKTENSEIQKTFKNELANCWKMMISKLNTEKEFPLGVINTLKESRKVLGQSASRLNLELKQLLWLRLNFVKRGVFRLIGENLKGVKRGSLFNSNSEIDSETTNLCRIFKGRPHKSCQDIFPACKFFDTLDKIIEIIVSESTGNNAPFQPEMLTFPHKNKIFEKLSNYDDHVKDCHDSEVKQVVTLIRKVVKDFNQIVKSARDSSSSFDASYKKTFTKALSSIKKINPYQEFITIRRLLESANNQKRIQDIFQEGAEIIVESGGEETIMVKDDAFSFPEFLRILEDGNVSEHLTEELKSLLSTGKGTIQMESILLQKEETGKKILYNYLAKYFKKEYLKTRVKLQEIICNHCSKIREIEGVKLELTKIERCNESLNRRKNWLTTVLEYVSSHSEIENTAENDAEDDISLNANRMLEFYKSFLKKQDSRQNLKERLEKLKAETKNCQVSDLKISNIQSTILNKPWVLGVSDEKSKFHFECNAKNKCDYISSVSALIEKTLHSLRKQTYKLYPPHYSLSEEKKQEIINSLPVSFHHSKTLHNSNLLLIVKATTENYVKEHSKILKEHDAKLQCARRNLYLSECDVAIHSEFFVPKLDQRILEISDFLEFKKNLKPPPQLSSEEKSAETELEIYIDAKIKIEIEKQGQLLREVFEKLFEAGGKVSKSSPNVWAALQNICFEVFKEHIPSLVCFIAGSQIHNILNNRAGKSDVENLSTFLKTMIQKSKGIEHILATISNDFSLTGQCYDEALDPLLIYKNILKQKKQKNKEECKVHLSKLNVELSLLIEEKKALFIQDVSICVDELSDIELALNALTSLETFSEFCSQVEEIDSSRSNKDDYYSFHLNLSELVGRYGIRILGDTSAEKYDEILKLEKVRTQLTHHDTKLLELKTQNESCLKQLAEEDETERSHILRQYQKVFFTKGFFLLGFDVHECGKPLSEQEAFVSAIVGFLIGESNIYSCTGFNATSSKIDRHMRQIFKTLETKNCNPSLVSIVEAVNEELCYDGSKIPKIAKVLQLKPNSSENVISEIFKIQDLEIGKHFQELIVFHHGTQKFILTDDGNGNIPSDIKFSALFSIVTNDKLLKYLCMERLEKVLHTDLQTDNKLGNIIKHEKETLAKISKLVDFNSQFCKCLYDNVSIDPSFLLSFLQFAEEEVAKDITKEKSLLKILKNDYLKNLFTLIKDEQGRRRIAHLDKKEGSKEELFLQEEISEIEEESSQLLKEIDKLTELIFADEELINSLNSQKEIARDKYEANADRLKQIISNYQNQSQSAQTALRELALSGQQGAEEFQEIQAGRKTLEKEQSEIAALLEQLETQEQRLNIEIKGLEGKQRQYEKEKIRLEKEAARKKKEESNLSEDICISQYLVTLLNNLGKILTSAMARNDASTIKLIKELVKIHSSLTPLLEAFKTQLNTNNTELWEGIDYDKLITSIAVRNTFPIGSEQEFFIRLKSIVSASVGFSHDILSTIVDGKVKQVLRFTGSNVCWSELAKKVEAIVSESIKSDPSCKGLHFDGDIFRSSRYGVTSLTELPEQIRKLVERRVELVYKSELIESKKCGKFQEAVDTINHLDLTFSDILPLYFHEIQVISSNIFVLNESIFLPGVNITIICGNMECVGDNLEINVSGRNGLPFQNPKASSGETKRFHRKEPKGDSGYGGYDGDDGLHSGHVLIKVDGVITGLEKIVKINVSGGNGGKGQLGGDGDEGQKGRDGSHGTAPNPIRPLGGQDTVGFGTPGSPGGKGGAPGKTGNPGRGGQSGIIDITDKNGDKNEKLTILRNPGLHSEDVFSRENFPKGGEGGKPGLYGLDQVKSFSNGFSKAKTRYTVVDRADLIRKRPELEDDILEGKGIYSCTKAQLVGFAIAAGALNLAGMLLSTLVFDTRFNLKEYSKNDEYRDRDQNKENERGQQNDDEPQKRADLRAPMEAKAGLTDTSGLFQALSEKREDDKVISGVELHQEKIAVISEELKDVKYEIDQLVHEERDITSDIQMLQSSLETKEIELRSIRQNMEQIRNRDSQIREEISQSNSRLLTNIKNAQNRNDNMARSSLQISQAGNGLRIHNNFISDLQDGKNFQLKLINEYLSMVKGRLDSNRNEVQRLKDIYNAEKARLESAKERLRQLQGERLASVLVEEEIEEEVEEEVEVQRVHEITQVLDREQSSNKFQKNNNNNLRQGKAGIDCLPYLHTENINSTPIPQDLSQLEPFLCNLIRHLRSGVYNDYETVINTIKSDLSERIKVANGEETMVLKTLLLKFEEGVKNVLLSNNLSQLNSTQCHHFHSHLKRLYLKLEKDQFAILETEETQVKSFLLSILQKVEPNGKCFEKLKTRFSGNYDPLLSDDKISEDLKKLIKLLEERRFFFLEKCAINFSEENKNKLTESEIAMMCFNNKIDKSINDLEDAVLKYKADCDTFWKDPYFSDVANPSKKRKLLELSMKNMKNCVVENVKDFVLPFQIWVVTIRMISQMKVRLFIWPWEILLEALVTILVLKPF